MSNHIDQNRLEVIKRSSDMRHENPWVLASYIPELLDEISLLQEEVLACNQELSLAHKGHQLSRESAIREAEQAVHARYEHLIEAASVFVKAAATDIYYRWRPSSDRAIETAANGIEKELDRLGRSVRAKEGDTK